MIVILNNRQEEISSESMTISELLQYRNFTFKMLVVKVNAELIPKDKYQVQRIKDGDDVMILHLISGG
ncbi:MAG: sulfur carrier protein ThiS [Bacteroidota bacterium]